MVRRKRSKEVEIPGPPRRPRDRRERIRRRIWLTIVGRGGRVWDTWVEDPGSEGIDVAPPWDEKEQHFSVGEGEGAYDIYFDEEHGLRRLTVYEDLPLAPVHLEKGNWKSVADMSEAVKTWIENIRAQRMAEIQEATEGIPPMVWMMVIIAVVSSVSHVLAVALG